MRLRRLDLARYGKFTDRSIDFGERVAGEPDLHVVYGPNEAGKSTAFAGFLDLLFGIEPQSRYGFLHPYATMRVGGCLELSAGMRELVRIKRRQASLHDGANEPVPDALLLGELGGLDRNAYRTMFSLDDDTLEAGGKSILASNGELGQLLFSASAGLSELSRTLLDLRLETEGFTRPHARGSELQQLKATLADLKQRRESIDTLASEYNRLAAARDGARSRYQAAQAERDRAQADLARVQRLLTALPRMAALDGCRERLAPLADLPDAPPGWLAELPGLQQAENRHRADTELAEAEVRRLSDELGAVILDERALRLAGRLEPLTALRARHLTAALDLPLRRQELARADGEVDAILTQVGRPGEPDPARLLLDAAQRAALNGLIVTRSGIEERLAAASDELAQALHELTEARCALAASGSAAVPSLGLLVAALAAWRASDHAVRLRSAAKAGARHAEILATRMAALAPWTGSADALAALILPDAAEVQAWQAAAEREHALLARRRAEVEQIESELDRRAAELAAMGRSAGLLSDREAGELRRAREAAWAEHRRRLDPASADAFEAAMRQDDIAGTARLGHERDLARLHEAAQALAVRHAEADRARALRDEAAVQCGRRSERVARAASGLGPELSAGISPARLLSWTALRGSALESLDLLRQAEREQRDAAADAVLLHDRLAAALGEAGVMIDPLAGPDALAALAQAAVDGALRGQALERAVAECERAVRRRELALQRTALADKTWLAEWHAACAACWLGENAAALPFASVREMLAAAAALAPALQARAGLAERIRSMEADQAAFGRELERLVPELGMAGLRSGEESPLDFAQAVMDRVQEACRADETRRALQAALAAAQERRRQVAAAALVHARRVEEMTAFMQTGSLIELAGKLRDAERRAELERQAVEAGRDILAALQVGGLADARALLDGQGTPELELERARLVAGLDDLDQRMRELYAAHLQADARIAAVGGDDAAARIEERRQTTLLEIEDKARGYLRLRAGIAAADRALRAYRDQHRSAMMNQAADAFRIISRGAYRGLGAQPDRDGDVLVALSADGGSKLAADLSKGTRFQLYLALRAAGYREFARLRRPVPFIADDIMETFDDFRAEETLRVFAGMARFGQVIYLTHHAHLRAMAERTIPGVRVHELAA